MQVAQPSFTTRPEIQGQFGAVTSTHWLASSAGMAVLEKGGNAFDAAVAAGFVLQVAEPASQWSWWVKFRRSFGQSASDARAFCVHKEARLQRQPLLPLKA